MAPYTLLIIYYTPRGYVDGVKVETGQHIFIPLWLFIIPPDLPPLLSPTHSRSHSHLDLCSHFFHSSHSRSHHAFSSRTASCKFPTQPLFSKHHAYSATPWQPGQHSDTPMSGGTWSSISATIRLFLAVSPWYDSAMYVSMFLLYVVRFGRCRLL